MANGKETEKKTDVYAYVVVKQWPDDDDGRVDVLAVCTGPDEAWLAMSEDVKAEREDAEFNDESPSYDLKETEAYIETELQGTIKWKIFKKPLGMSAGWPFFG